jgi:hypothetical protein
MPPVPVTIKILDESLNEKRGVPPLIAQFNPPEMVFTKGVQFAPMNIPGLDAPIIQFVRGDSQTITFDLFFDTTDEHKMPVTELTEKFFALAWVDGHLHAPPVVRFAWGGGKWGRWKELDCVIENISQTFLHFDADGRPKRALIKITAREYLTLGRQLTETPRFSADRSRQHVVQEGETLPQIAQEIYSDPAEWRRIADHNPQLEDVRDLEPGVELLLPPRPTEAT